MNQPAEFCPEVTAKVLRTGYQIHEVPISYFPRTPKKGKNCGSGVMGYLQRGHCSNTALLPGKLFSESEFILNRQKNHNDKKHIRMSRRFVRFLPIFLLILTISVFGSGGCSSDEEEPGEFLTDTPINPPDPNKTSTFQLI